MQLIEVAVVAAARKAGVKLHDIAIARDYASKALKSKNPFAEYRFKTDGRNLCFDYNVIDPKAEGGRVVVANKRGQLAWESILGRLDQFEYDEGLALRWRVAGKSSPIVIDPRISFGAPNVKGVPTRTLKDRWISGEPVDEIADDYGLSRLEVQSALEFEDVDISQPNTWVH